MTCIGWLALCVYVADGFSGVREKAVLMPQAKSANEAGQQIESTPHGDGIIAFATKSNFGRLPSPK